MKTKNKETYKVKFDELKDQFNFSDELDEHIKKRINQINRTNTIPRKILERRSLELQAAYIEVMKLDLSVIKELEKIAIEHQNCFKSHSQNSKEFREIDKQFENFCKKVGLSKSVTSYYNHTGYKTEYKVCPVALLDVLIAYQF